LLKKAQPRTKHEVDRMTRCCVMAIWIFHTRYRRPETVCDFIFCPMLLCSALDRQKFKSTLLLCWVAYLCTV